MLVALSALAGAIHVAAPDHWVPASILSWQRRWSLWATILFSTLTLTIHLLLGVGLYFILRRAISEIDSSQWFSYSLAFVGVMMGLRALRFSSIRDVQRLGPRSRWGLFAVPWLLGPCESMVPILIKSSSLGLGYWLPFGACLAGTLFTGTVLILSGQFAWNRPFWLTRGLDWVNQRMAVLPIAAGMGLGLRYLLRLG
jgi:hypothetical protein